MLSSGSTTSMNRRRRAPTGVLALCMVNLLSFTYLSFSSQSQSAYWSNKNLICCNWCVDTLGSFTSNMVLKLLICDLWLSYLLYHYMSVHFFDSSFVIQFFCSTRQLLYCSMTCMLVQVSYLCLLDHRHSNLFDS